MKPKIRIKCKLPDGITADDVASAFAGGAHTVDIGPILEIKAKGKRLLVVSPGAINRLIKAGNELGLRGLAVNSVMHGLDGQTDVTIRCSPAEAEGDKA